LGDGVNDKALRELRIQEAVPSLEKPRDLGHPERVARRRKQSAEILRFAQGDRVMR